MNLSASIASRSLAAILAFWGFTAVIPHGASQTDQAPSPTLEKAAFDWDLNAPATATIEQVFDSIAVGATSRVALRAGPVVESSLFPLLLESLLEHDETGYEEFVEESGFDPAEHFSGLLLYSEDDFEDLESLSVVLGLEESTDITAFFEYLDEQNESSDDDEEEEEESDSPDDLAITILYEFSDDEIDLVFSTATDLGDGDEEPFEIVEFSDARLGYRVEENHALCIYIWDSGAVVTIQGVDSEDARASTESKISALLESIDEASRVEIDSVESELALEMTGSAEGRFFDIEILLGDSTAVSFTVELETEELEFVQQVIAALPIFRSNPEMLDELVPEEYLELIKAALDNAQISLQDLDLSVDLEVPTDLLEDFLQDL